MQLVPFTSDPWRSFSTGLNGVEYRFDCNFNERNQRWAFDLSLESTGQMLAAGVPILLGCDLLLPYGLGIGSLVAIDNAAAAATEGAGILPQAVDAGPEDLGTRVQVVYLAPGDVPA